MTKHKDSIIELYSQGKSYKQIQDILGCSKGTIAYHIGDGQKEKTRIRTNRNRTIKKREIWDMKESSGCVDCKEKYPHYMLEFDHLPEFEKSGSPTQLMQTHSWSKAMDEMEKCEIVCANCHKIRTWSRYLETIGM
jgi:NADPH-dependent glutamate synthase beta subunit-like oxidoreductase